MSRWIVPLFVVCIACSHEKFALQKNTGWPIDGKTIGDYHKVDVAADNMLVLRDSAQVGFRCKEITDGIFDTEATIGKNDTLSMQFRTTPYDDTVKQMRGLRLRITESLVTAIHDADTVYKAVAIAPDKPFRIVVTQHGNYTDLEVACTKVGRMITKVPTTQWIIARVSSDGNAQILDPTFRPLFEEDE